MLGSGSNKEAVVVQQRCPSNRVHGLRQTANVRSGASGGREASLRQKKNMIDAGIDLRMRYRYSTAPAYLEVAWTDAFLVRPGESAVDDPGSAYDGKCWSAGSANAAIESFLWMKSLSNCGKAALLVQPTSRLFGRLSNQFSTRRKTTAAVVFVWRPSGNESFGLGGGERDLEHDVGDAARAGATAASRPLAEEHASCERYARRIWNGRH